MTMPCVVYVQNAFSNFGETFSAQTARNEQISGWISQQYMTDTPEVRLVIDGIAIDVPENLDYVQAREWVIEEIKSLGYHIIEIKR